MRQLRYVDYDCPDCGASCTRFVNFDTDAGVPLESQTCHEHVQAEGAAVGAKCQSVLVPREMAGVGYMKTISKGDHDFNERERERLEKRGDDHWKRQGRDEAVDRERAFFKKMGADGAGGVK